MKRTLVVHPFRLRLQKLAGAALDFVFPPECAGCGIPGAEFCDRCAQKVEPLPHTVCAKCGRPQQSSIALCRECRAGHVPLTLSRAAALHTAPLREAIHTLKYQDRPQLAQPLGRYLVAAFQQAPWTTLASSIDAVVPAPLHVERLQERGYNQSELLAAALCHACSLDLQPGWLARVRATRQQVGLTADERMQNVAGAFAADPAVNGRTLLVVDDVYTTGATLHACAEAALAAGAPSVFALTLAIPARA